MIFDEEIITHGSQNDKVALIDVDSLIYQVAFYMEKEKDYNLTLNLHSFIAYIQNLIQKTGNKEAILYITGAKEKELNFRYSLYKNYKGKRNNKFKLFKPFKEYLLNEIDTAFNVIKELKAIKIVEKAEPDDYIVSTYKQTKNAENLFTIIAIDKDVLNNCYGTHFNYRLGTFIKNDFINSFIYCFIQTLLGDVTDNVAGLYKFGKVKANKLKEVLVNELKISQEHSEEEKQDCQNLLFAVVFNLFNRYELNEEKAFNEALLNYRLVNMEQLDIETDTIQLKSFDFDTIQKHKSQALNLIKLLNL